MHDSTPKTAREGWMARFRGMVKQFFNPTQQRQQPFPVAPIIPNYLLDDQLQLEGDGFGKLLGRCYEVVFSSALLPSELMRRVFANLEQLSPEELAAFEKSRGSSRVLKLGDEFEITIFGPWNGKVRVIEITETAFGFATLQGHPEAGKIRFSVRLEKAGRLHFQIMSWARSRDQIVDLTYDKLGIAKNLQATTWRTFLERVVELGNGQMIGRILITETLLEAATDD